MRAPQGLARGAQKEMCRQGVRRRQAPTLQSCPPGPPSKSLRALATFCDRDAHRHSQRRSALPLISSRFVTPKYLPSRERGCSFSRKTSCTPSVRQPCQRGRLRPASSRSNARAASAPLIKMRHPSRQTVSPASPRTRLMRGQSVPVNPRSDAQIAASDRSETAAHPFWMSGPSLFQ